MVLELNNIFPEQNDIILEDLHQNIYNNIENIKKEYNHILKPEKNNTTLRYIKEGYSEDESYTLSFMTTLMVYLQVSGINI